MSNDGCALSIDLGGTKVEIAIVDPQGTILTHERLPTHVENGAERVVEDILSGATALMQRSSYKIIAVGAGVAGQISSNGKEVLFAPNLKWRNFPFKEKLEKRLSLPCTILNDVRAATWGEWLHGAGKNCSDFLCLFLGTGIGGGIVAGGHLINGFSNAAGELGHTTLREGGRLCSCGHRGCLEAYAGGWGIAVTLKEAATSSPKKAAALIALAGGDAKALKAEHLSEAVKKNDPFAQEIYSQVIKSLSNGCVTFVNAFNPKLLIFGGGVALGMPMLLEKVQEEVKKSALGATGSPLQVIPATLGNTAVVIGAAAAALQSATFGSDSLRVHSA